MANERIQARKSRREEEEQLQNALKYGTYSKNLLSSGEQAELGRFERKQYLRKLKFRADLDCGNRDGAQKEEIRISPELTVVWEKIKKERDPKICEEITRNLLELPPEEGGCLVISVEKLREALKDLADEEDDESLEWMWYALSTDGIEIHPGVLSDSDEPEAVALGDDCVHALMAGRTGAGKSVALHAIITSMMQEYAPWELNINLADFKIVELSKYGNDADNKAPHVMKIAATDSMEYVLSVMYDMYEKMDIRQKVFAALGLQKLADYRKKFGVVLPREILIVDEFQQMYELASAGQTRMIDQLIKMITKLGRATGYHLFFASQSMSGTIGSDVIANFKLRLCLSASEEVSGKVLGNGAAAALTGTKGKGYLITNNEGGAKEYNKEYQVPFVREAEDGTGDLQDVLRRSAWLAREVGYRKNLDFYKEDYRRRLTGDGDSFEKDLGRFAPNAARQAALQDDIDLYLLLGDSCVYAKSAQKNTDLEYCPVKIGDKKNIICAGDSIAQRAYMMKLLQMQFKENDAQGRDLNFIVHADMLVKEMLDPAGFEEIPLKKFTEKALEELTKRSVTYKFIQYPKEDRTQDTLYGIISRTYKDKMLKQYSNALKEKGMTQKDMESWAEGILKTGHLKAFWESYLANTEDDNVAYQFKREKRVTFWVNGFHMLSDLLDEWNKYGSPMKDFLKTCTSMGIRFVFVGTSLAEMPGELRDYMGYFFIMGNDEKNFLLTGMEQGKGYRDGIVRFKAKKEVLNRQKPGLYILGQDEKIVKMYEVEGRDIGNVEKELFQGMG